jgi:hypothetical protein
MKTESGNLIDRDKKTQSCILFNLCNMLIIALEYRHNRYPIGNKAKGQPTGTLFALFTVFREGFPSVFPIRFDTSSQLMSYMKFNELHSEHNQLI